MGLCLIEPFESSRDFRLDSVETRFISKTKTKTKKKDLMTCSLSLSHSYWCETSLLSSNPSRISVDNKRMNWAKHDHGCSELCISISPKYASYPSNNIRDFSHDLGWQRHWSVTIRTDTVANNIQRDKQTVSALPNIEDAQTLWFCVLSDCWSKASKINLWAWYAWYTNEINLSAAFGWRWFCLPVNRAIGGLECHYELGWLRRSEALANPN
jgi:hypothetical protein